MKGLVLLLFALCSAQQAAASQATVAVAANFSATVRSIVPLFENTSGYAVKVSYASTGTLYSQIAQGAPFDVFLAADTVRPTKAEDDGLAVRGTRFTYATGKLVLWSASPGLFSNGEAYLTQSAFRRIAIANPKTAPYGLAARQVMEHLGVWNSVQSRLVRGDSIGQTFQFVTTGNAQTGIVALSQLRAWHGDKGTFWEIPDSYYRPIAQQAVLLKRGQDNPAAKAFLEFLKGPEARAIIAGYGYGLE